MGEAEDRELSQVDEEFLRALTQIFERLETDDTLIHAITGTGWEDGHFYVCLEMKDGREVSMRFEVSEPIPTVTKPRLPTQYARLLQFDEAQRATMECRYDRVWPAPPATTTSASSGSS